MHAGEWLVCGVAFAVLAFAACAPREPKRVSYPTPPYVAPAPVAKTKPVPKRRKPGQPGPRFDVIAIKLPAGFRPEVTRFGVGGRVLLGKRIWRRGTSAVVPNRGFYTKRVYAGEMSYGSGPMKPHYARPLPPTVTCMDSKGNYAGYY